MENMAESEYTVLLMQISDLINKDDLSQLKFECMRHNFIREREQKNINSALDLWQLLEKKELLRQDNVLILKSLITSCKVDARALRLLEAYESYKALDQIPSDGKLSSIAENIGVGWQLLAANLGIDHTRVDIIELGRFKTFHSICGMLLSWKKLRADSATLRELFYQMHQTGNDLNWDIDEIATSLNLKKRDIIDCKVKGTAALASTDRTLAEKKNMKSYRAPKDVCMYDGRLFKLGETDRKTLKSECKEENEIGSGGFGKVYASKTSIPGFDMRVAIKRVCAEGEHVMKTVKREMNASRILHPFILPLLAVFEEEHIGHKRHTDYYIISPYCEKNSLRMVIDENPDKLSQFQRIRIGLQLALAIQYLHTPVKNVRKGIYHKDITSKNVVLDVNLNARLIDFGLAREEDDCTSTGAGTEGYRHPKKGDGLSNMALVDYFAFGVVLRELLTDIKPTGITVELTGLVAPEKFKNKHLCNIESDDMLKYLDYKKLKWWPMDDDNTRDNAKVVNDVAAHCFKATEVEWQKVISQLKNLVQGEVKDLKMVEKQCEVCMINSKGKSIQLYHPDCRRKMAVCVACEKNSFFNPITCFTCGKSIQPIIGKEWGALLVAGDGIKSVDQNSKDTEERVFKGDVAEIKRVITSRAPLIMGISPENVEEVLQDNKQILPRLEEAFQRLQNCEVTKMFIYVSCHGSSENDNEFIFGSETLSLAKFQGQLDMLSNIKTFVIILDRCFPPKIELKNAENVLQFNASKSSQASHYQNSSGSLFTRFFIQALKGKSENVKCLLKTGSDNEECCLCSEFRSDEKDYLSVKGVFSYVEGHMDNEKATPVKYVKGDDLGYLGYYTDEEVRIEITHELDDGKRIPIQLEPKFFRTIEEVKTELLNQCKANANSIVKIEMDTCRQDNPREECSSIEMVMSAWAYRKPLYVKFITTQL